MGAILEAILGSQGHINDVGGNLDFSALSLRSPHQEFCSPSFISSFCRRALPSHSFGSWGQVLLGIQGEREAGAVLGASEEKLSTLEAPLLHLTFKSLGESDYL